MTTQADGQCKINGVQVAELSVQIDVASSSAMLYAKYALLNTTEGDRFGSGNKNVGWSEETQMQLLKLLKCMEQDICQDLFSGGATTDSSVTTGDGTIDGVPGF